MKISLNWLKDYVKTDLQPAAIADILSNIGFTCDGIQILANDTVFDFDVTSNRGDCLGHIGIARELAAATNSQLIMPVVTLDESTTSASDFVTVEIKEPSLCWRYTARIIQDAKIGPSPDWLVNRLEAVGLRSVNNVVDATNYAMMETGQPPHAFDYEKIEGKKIIVRKALAGEQIISIDGSKCQLDPDMLIIADAKKPIAIAGVMGGLLTEVSENTKTILLEDAFFDPVTVRTASRRLSLPSDAAYRFGRIVDVQMIDWASKRTAQLITQLAGGKVARGVVDAYPQKPQTKSVTLKFSSLNNLLGIEIPQQAAINILTAIGFNPVKSNDSVTCTIPSWRSDIYREVDLIEEVARHYGYDKIPTRSKIEIQVIPADAQQKCMRQIGSYLNGCGFYETINVAFVDEVATKLFASDETASYLSVTDVTGQGANILRQSLLPSLLGVLKTNLNVKNSPCRIFEIADTFVPANQKNTLPVEKTKITLVCDNDFRFLRGVVEGLVKNIDADAQIEFRPANLKWAQAGADILMNGTVIGCAGIISDDVLKKLGFKNIVPSAAELDFAPFLAVRGKVIKVKPVSRFPAIERDLSIVVDEAVTWAQISTIVNESAVAEFEDVRFVEIYRSKDISSGQKSVTLSLRFRDEQGTLTHEQVNEFEKAIMERLSNRLGAKLRTL